MDEEEVKKLIQSCLVTEKRCMPLKTLMREFRDLVGMNIPYVQLGYKTVVDLLKTIPGIRKEGTNMDGDIVLAFDASDSTMGHIQDMVKRQVKKNTGRSSSAKFVVRRTAQPPRRMFGMQMQPPPRFRSQQFSPWKNSNNFNTRSTFGATNYAPEQRSFSSPSPTVCKPVNNSYQMQNIPSHKENAEPNYPQPKIAAASIYGSSKPLGEMNYEKENLKLHNEPIKQQFEDDMMPKKSAPLPFSTYNQENWANLKFSSYSPQSESGKKQLSDGYNGIPDKPVDEKVEKILTSSVPQSFDEHYIKSEDEAALPEEQCRVKYPTFQNYQLIGDDFLLYFSYRNLNGKLKSETMSCGMCYSGATIKQSLLRIRLDSDIITHKIIIMLGHMDILESNYNFEKSKWYMTLMLEELSLCGSKVKLLTLPPLYPKTTKISQRIDEFNRWIRSLHDPPNVSVFDLELVFVEKDLNSALYKRQKHFPNGKTTAISMWSKLGREKVFQYLKGSV